MEEYAQSQPCAMMIEGTAPGVTAAVRSALEGKKMKRDEKLSAPQVWEGLYAAQTARKKVSGKNHQGHGAET
jgi:hypothetical protein